MVEVEQTKNCDILNVAEMLLHGVADNEILDIWLRSIQCEEFVAKFIEAGYDMPTISRVTPQDLTAIGVTEPTKRLKILTEIKKLNLQDGIPDFRPASLSHLLNLIRLDSYYYKLLCDQQIDTIEKLCQLTWEDFEELGITRLGHQKRFQLAIERVKDLSSPKPISEPIYDTNPSQILLVASTENHIMNGPIINKQSSISELSSIGSGSMHSVYSSASTHYRPPSIINMNHMQNGNNHNINHDSQGSNSNQQIQAHQHQPIYSQIPPPARQSMSQLTFSALAKLPKQQQQLLQQSSIYATLSRQPSKAKQPPPPVPIRTNSLKSNTLTDHIHRKQHQQHPYSTQQQPQQTWCNATTGRDDDFPPPPSPLSLSDSDEHDLVSLNSDTNYSESANHGLMTFRVGGT